MPLEKKKARSKKPLIKIIDYQALMEKEVIGLLKIRQFYEVVERFEDKYRFSQHEKGTEPFYGDIGYIKDALKDQMETHMDRLEGIVKKSSGLHIALDEEKKPSI